MTILPDASPPESPAFRARAADALVSLGVRLQRALVELALCVDPRLGLPVGEPARPWAGILIVVLLVAGVAFIGGGTVWAISEALPLREHRS